MTEAMAESSGLITRQLQRMRVCWGAALLGPAAAIASSFVMPRMHSALLAPRWVTLLAVVASLWLAFTANADARRRLEHVKRGFAAHADRQRLLREYLVVYLFVLFRLELMAAAGVVIAGWGVGARVALLVHLAALALIALSCPNRRKIELLLARAEAKRSAQG